MIALCRNCHDDAEGGAYTKEQLREFKRKGRDSVRVSHAFRHGRESLLTRIAGNNFATTRVLI
jgi:hypothetical protein